VKIPEYVLSLLIIEIACILLGNGFVNNKE
jgi:hypothetical protein